MPNRTGFVAVSNTAYTAAQHAKMPKGWIGWSQKTGNQTTITTTADVTDLSVTVTPASNRLLRVSFQLNFQRTVADGLTVFLINAGGSAVKATGWSVRAASEEHTALGWVLSMPAGGSPITYKIQAWNATGTGSTSVIAADTTNPSMILVEDIGPSS